MRRPEDDIEGIQWAGLPSPAVLRAGAGLAAAVALGLVGGLAIGEFQLDAGTAVPYVAGLLFGLVVGEVVVEVGRRRTFPVAVAAGATSAGGLLLAGVINQGAGTYPVGALLAAGIALVTATARVWQRRRV